MLDLVWAFILLVIHGIILTSVLRDFAIPTTGALLATLLVAIAAGVSDWSAPGIYGGMAGVGLIWVALLAWTDRRHLHK